MWLEIWCDMLVVVREPLCFGYSKLLNEKSIRKVYRTVAIGP